MEDYQLYKNIYKLSDLEKERIRRKMGWEGGLSGFLSYGVPTILSLIFDEIVECYELYNNGKPIPSDFEDRLTKYLSDNIFYKDNDVDIDMANYILSEEYHLMLWRLDVSWVMPKHYYDFLKECRYYMYIDLDNSFLPKACSNRYDDIWEGFHTYLPSKNAFV